MSVLGRSFLNTSIGNCKTDHCWRRLHCGHIFCAPCIAQRKQANNPAGPYHICAICGGRERAVRAIGTILEPVLALVSDKFDEDEAIQLDTNCQAMTSIDDSLDSQVMADDEGEKSQ